VLCICCIDENNDTFIELEAGCMKEFLLSGFLIKMMLPWLK